MKNRVERPLAGAIDQQERGGEYLRVVSTNFVQDGPDADLWWCWRQRKRRGTEVQRDLGAEDGDNHFDDKWDRNEPGAKAGHQQKTSDDFEAGDEDGGFMWEGNADLSEAADALIGVDELQYAFPEEDTSGHKAKDEDGFRAVGGGTDEPRKKSVHGLLLVQVGDSLGRVFTA